MNEYTKLHQPVLVNEVVAHLSIDDGLIIDATFGGGGHTHALLEKNPTMHVVGLDWDKKSLEQFGAHIEESFPGRYTPIFGNFAHLYKIVRKHKLPLLDGILADFGTSFMQIFEADGFSFTVDSPLDMRMSHSHYMQTAADIVNTASVHELAHILWTYGQESQGKKIAQAIVYARHKKKIVTTTHLASIVLSVVPWSKKMSIHPATKTFQALRIVVNRELENITAFLHGAFSVLKPGGKLVCISFHSLEDGLVKDFFNEKASLGCAHVLMRKPVVATDREIANNPSARSAKMRVLQKM